MSQRKLKKGIEEQKSATINKISNIVSDKTEVQMLTFWTESNGNEWYTKEHCKLVAIEKTIKEHQAKIQHLKNKYK